MRHMAGEASILRDGGIASDIRLRQSLIRRRCMDARSPSRQRVHFASHRSGRIVASQAELTVRAVTD